MRKGLDSTEEKFLDGDNYPLEMPLSTPLEESQEMMYQAWEATGAKRTSMALRALRISPDCADAYVLLAEENSKNTGEAIELYKKGVEAGERSLGKGFFKTEKGNFWIIKKTRPYMRARNGLAKCLWAIGEKETAVDHLKEMLELNPEDNQGIRYPLISYLIELNRDKEAWNLIEKYYKHEKSAPILFNRALLLFRQEQNSRKANAALNEAIQENSFVQLFLLKKKETPSILPKFYSIGDEKEGVIYASQACPAWKNTKGALEWLSKASHEDFY
jgi:tetratricopeptide (TPR) repeat protein